MPTKQEPAVILLFDGASGQYIPQRFANEIVRDCVKGVSADDYATLENGPDHEWYWEAWDSVLNGATLTIGGDTYALYQDGDVWALCYARMTDEEKENFGFFDE
jgi:hypothetical protein